MHVNQEHELKHQVDFCSIQAAGLICNVAETALWAAVNEGVANG